MHRGRSTLHDASSRSKPVVRSKSMPASSARLLDIEDRLRGSLWGLFIADALAAPTHWFYGGSSQVMRDYPGGIRGYRKPNRECEASIMNKSNTGGPGRGSYDEGRIIGEVINHGKKPYWKPGKSFHYHCTLEAGENTLEAQLVRVLLRSVAAQHGSFDADDFRRRYVDFMTTPGSHNDCYASSCHRVFFANYAAGVPVHKCPGNDGHNVDTADGLVLPTVVALAAASQPRARADDLVQGVVRVTRKSPVLEQYATVWNGLLRAVLQGSDLKRAVLAACHTCPALSRVAREAAIGRFDAVVS
eukprot:gnl/TRDRNA2_/TRDRNA2_39701_c0_seq1.p1 gnl/TRDRNA2_/TRDRNA2_39701_c0~~gnl/TRDRNA2_/TRDRNA2_39701_c0_seq1.p1  ORF type:complete len:302 (+),score=31.57 gnl/TRDRNA2_/TRDRNA2_39701_c0_seq1:77-982(+)